MNQMTGVWVRFYLLVSAMEVKPLCIIGHKSVQLIIHFRHCVDVLLLPSHMAVVSQPSISS